MAKVMALKPNDFLFNFTLYDSSVVPASVLSKLQIRKLKNQVMISKTRLSITLQVICSLLIFLFAYTAVSKLSNFGLFQALLSQSPLIGEKAILVAWLLPPFELVMAILLLVPRTRAMALLGSFILLLVFTGYTVYMLLSSTKLPCSCGGVFRSLGWREHLLLNIFFTLLTLTGLYAERKTQEI